MEKEARSIEEIYSIIKKEIIKCGDNTKKKDLSVFILPIGLNKDLEAEIEKFYHKYHAKVSNIKNHEEKICVVREIHNAAKKLTKNKTYSKLFYNKFYVTIDKLFNEAKV